MSTIGTNYPSGSFLPPLHVIPSWAEPNQQIAPHHDLEKEAGPSFSRDTWTSVKARRSQGATPSFRGFRVFKNPNLVDLRAPSADPSARGTAGEANEASKEESLTDAASTDKNTRPEDFDSLVKQLESGMKRLNINMYEQRYHGKVFHHRHQSFLRFPPNALRFSLQLRH